MGTTVRKLACKVMLHRFIVVFCADGSVDVEEIGEKSYSVSKVLTAI